MANHARSPTPRRPVHCSITLTWFCMNQRFWFWPAPLDVGTYVEDGPNFKLRGELLGRNGKFV